MFSNFFEVIQKISGQNHSMALNFNLDFGGKWGSTLFMHGPFALGATPKFKFEGLIYYLASASIHSAGTLPGGIVQSLKKPACTLLQSGCLAEAQIFFRILAKSQKFSKSHIYAWPHLWMGPHDLWVAPDPLKFIDGPFHLWMAPQSETSNVWPLASMELPHNL